MLEPTSNRLTDEDALLDARQQSLLVCFSGDRVLSAIWLSNGPLRFNRSAIQTFLMTAKAFENCDERAEKLAVINQHLSTQY